MFAGGLWIIPLGLLMASIWSFYRGFLAWRSGSRWWGKKDGIDVIMESDDKVPYWSVGQNVFGIILLLAAIGTTIWMYLER